MNTNLAEFTTMPVYTDYTTFQDVKKTPPLVKLVCLPTYYLLQHTTF